MIFGDVTEYEANEYDLYIEACNLNLKKALEIIRKYVHIEKDDYEVDEIDEEAFIFNARATINGDYSEIADTLNKEFLKENSDYAGDIKLFKYSVISEIKGL